MDSKEFSKKYSIIYKALELACLDLYKVNNPNKAPLDCIISHYINEAEKRLSLINDYKPISMDFEVCLDVGSSCTNSDNSDSNDNGGGEIKFNKDVDSNDEIDDGVNFNEKVLLNRVKELEEVCTSVFNEKLDSNLVYYKSKLMDSLNKSVESIRANYNNPSIKRSIVRECISSILNSIQDAHYRFSSSKEGFNSNILSVIGDFVYELNDLLSELDKLNS